MISAVVIFLHILQISAATNWTSVGDIILPDGSQDINDIWKNSWANNENQLWPEGKILYLFDIHFTELERDKIRSYLKKLTEPLSPGCITFSEVEEKPEFPPYLFFGSNGCKSHIGKQENRYTVVHVDSNCIQSQSVIHEVMHALGAAHEHNRPDRDLFVSINTTNIRKGRQDDFRINEKYTQTLKTPYDYFSVMHYPRNAFAKDPRYDTIQPKLELKDDFLRRPAYELSAVDVVELSRLYDCEIKPEIQVEYNNYLVLLNSNLLDKTIECFGDFGSPVDECETMLEASENILEESEEVLSGTALELMLIQHQRALLKKEFREFRLNEEISKGGCETGWTFDSDTGICYFFLKESYTWKEAENKCRTLGGHLASIHSFQENRFISSSINDFTWIGLTDQETESKYIWTDGSPVDYLNWKEGQPNNLWGIQDCMAITNNFWWDEYCTKKYNAVCKKD